MSKLSITTRLSKKASGDLLTWDTEFWGMKIGKASSSNIDKWAVENTIGCICLLVPLNHVEEIQAAEERGFRFMDIRVTLGCRTRGQIANVHSFKAEEIDSLAEIARVSHRITRFYADPVFSDERCDDLYETWLRSSCDGWADDVIVVGEAQGYCTVHINDGVGSIGLIAVEENARGNGLGTDLVCGAIDHCYTRGIEKITVVTQGRNVSALRLFERCGFQITQTEWWGHRHYESS